MKFSTISKEIQKQDDPKDSTSLQAMPAQEKEKVKQTLKLLKMQRNSLLGTLAGCLEYLKKVKQDKQFSSSFARKFRNYLFKGKRFLLHEKQTFEVAMQLNADIINMVNEVIHCIRSEKREGIDAISAIKSPLFIQLKQEAELLTLKDAPSFNLCNNGIKLSNLELQLYESCQDINPILVACARKYSQAARGSFALWIRDLYPEQYKQSNDYKLELDSYIKVGNKIRHRDAELEAISVKYNLG